MKLLFLLLATALASGQTPTTKAPVAPIVNPPYYIKQQLLQRHAQLYKGGGTRYFELKPQADGSLHFPNSYATDGGGMARAESEPLPAPTPPQASDWELAQKAIATLYSRCNFMVVATVTDQRSALNRNQTLVFSDWDFLLREIIKNDDKFPVKPGDSIVVSTTGGGTVMVAGHRVVGGHFNGGDDTSEFTINHDYATCVTTQNDGTFHHGYSGDVFDVTRSFSHVNYILPTGEEDNPYLLRISGYAESLDPKSFLSLLAQLAGVKK